MIGRMREADALGADQVVQTERGARTFALGKRVMFLRNERSSGVKNGTLGTLQKIERGSVTVRLGGAEQRQVGFDKGLRPHRPRLRAAVEALAKALPGARAPDYSPTLGAIAQRLEAIESHPALQTPPDQVAARIRAAESAVAAEARRYLRSARDELASAARDMRGILIQARTAQQQDVRLLQVGAGGLVLGAVLWAMVSVPIARRLPASWHVPEKMAARTLALDRWEAGGRLMQSVSPQGWVRLIEASEVEQANRSTLENCRAAALRLNKAQPCTIRLKAPSQVAPPPAAGTPP